MAKKQQVVNPGVVDRGTFAGSFAATLVLAAWLITEFGHGAQQSKSPDSQPSASQPASSRESLRSTDTAPPAAPKAPAIPAWQADSRWKDSIELAEKGLDQQKKALRWKEEKGGDPFYFAAQIAEAGDKVEKALRGFNALKEDFSEDSSAISAIEKRIRHYEDRLPRRRK